MTSAVAFSAFVAKRGAFLVRELLSALLRSSSLCRMKPRAKLTRRLAEDAFESAIELGERLKAGVIGYLADADIGIEQPGARTFHADT